MQYEPIQQETSPVTSQPEPIDVHDDLMPYDQVLQFAAYLESEGLLKAYCNGSNLSGRWIFQILNSEFIDELADIVRAAITTQEGEGPVLEVMAGDGRLTEFLRSRLAKEVVATDAKDGRYNIAYPKWVANLDALSSVREYSPSLVIMSWEPYLSTAGAEIADTGVPLVWIGNPEMCGVPRLFDLDHTRVRSKYAMSRHDSFLDGTSKSDIYLFNMDR
ncbi:hypothetical protein EU545_03305 [Candidatus Thorarchaeota archaeon]|nr:MAG: hypothetical protein EU545_03305 [Candidatus Thorarchaeota archaeon]